MKAVIQRVSSAHVRVEERIVGKIQQGFLLLLGITHDDTISQCDHLIEKVIHLRVFEDLNHKMNLSLQDIKGELLIVSQFTLYADCQKSRRPSFTQAAGADQAQQLYDFFVAKAKEKLPVVETGIFGAKMSIQLVNEGPATFILTV